MLDEREYLSRNGLFLCPLRFVGGYAYNFDKLPYLFFEFP